MTALARWILAYGVFLLACGLAGYLSNPEKAKTALISGGTFGVLSIVWGALMARGARWSRWAALTTSGFLVAVFTWRASASWLAVADGATEKRFAAILITLMGAASLAVCTALLRRRPGNSDAAAGEPPSLPESSHD
ncbi:MAG TPA: TMEM14 family protein [Verrucomicrobiota bacterium]|nr:TMEM14 family protein [Verrucomicrobiota bacterium]